MGIPWRGGLALLALSSMFPVPATAQLTAKIPRTLTDACDVDRAALVATTVAHNPEIYPDRAVRIEDGWLVYDRYHRQILELDDDLVEVGRWGRRGPGPVEYERPIGFARTASGEMVVVDRDPPSLIVLGDAPREQAIPMSTAPVHALVLGDDVVLAGKDGTLHRVPVDGARSVAEVRSAADFGITRSAKGALPVMLLRPGPRGSLYVGFKGPSTIWTTSGTPRQMVARCVPDRLRTVHESAPTIEVSGYGAVPYTVETLQDFVVLDSGRTLTLGGLRVGGDDAARSVELYERDGTLVQSWRLDRSAIEGLFDPTNPTRLLIWKQKGVEGVQLIEVAGSRYPS